MNKLDVWGRVLFGDSKPGGEQAPLSPFLEQMWRRSGRANPGSSDPEEREGFVFWYIRHFYRRGGLHWPLPPALLAWLNAPAADLSREIREGPGLNGNRPNTEPTYISRYMQHARQLEGQQFNLKETAGFFEFLTWYAFRFMPQHQVPAALLPSALLEQLNRPAGDQRLPLTTGMLTWERIQRPERFQQLVEGSEAKALRHLLRAGARGARFRESTAGSGVCVRILALLSRKWRDGLRLRHKPGRCQEFG